MSTGLIGKKALQNSITMLDFTIIRHASGVAHPDSLTSDDAESRLGRGVVNKSGRLTRILIDVFTLPRRKGHKDAFKAYRKLKQLWTQNRRWSLIGQEPSLGIC